MSSIRVVVGIHESLALDTTTAPTRSVPVPVPVEPSMCMCMYMLVMGQCNTYSCNCKGSPGRRHALPVCPLPPQSVPLYSCTYPDLLTSRQVLVVVPSASSRKARLEMRSAGGLRTVGQLGGMDGARGQLPPRRSGSLQWGCCCCCRACKGGSGVSSQRSRQGGSESRTNCVVRHRRRGCAEARALRRAGREVRSRTYTGCWGLLVHTGCWGLLVRCREELI